MYVPVLTGFDHVRFVTKHAIRVFRVQCASFQVNCNDCSGVRINELKSIELPEYDHNTVACP